METIYDVPVLLRREIEALMLKPFVDEMEKELGREKTLAIIEKVVSETAKAQGAEYVQVLGGNDIDALHRQADSWGSNDALEFREHMEDDHTLCQDITKCAYVDMYERIGMKDLGYLLSCLRDEYFYQGFNPKMVMTRTKTRMNGDDCCDFCFKFPKEED